MDHLSQVCLENTVTVKLDCILNQEILSKNFNIILNALKDLKSQQDKHTNQLNNLSSLKQLFDKFKQEQNNINDQLKGINGLNGNNTSSNSNNQNNSNNETHFNKSEDNTKQSSNISKNDKIMSNSDLTKQIQKIKQRMNKQDGFINQNTKDVNILTKDMHQVKDQIQKLKSLINNNGLNNQMSGSNNSNQINMESINNINKQAHRSREDINKLLIQMDNMKNKINNIQKQLGDLKNNQNNIQSIIQNNNDKNINNSQSSNNNNNNNIDSNKLIDILRKIDNLSKKTDMIQQQCNQNVINLQNNKQDTNKNGQDIDNIHKQLQKISKILSKIQNIHNLDQTNLQGQIQKIKDQINMIFKLIDNIRPASGTQDKKNKPNTDRSFRIRSDSTAKQDINSKINQLNARLAYLQKTLGSKSSIEDPQKLPQIKNSRRQINQTGFNKDSKAYKKQLNDLKHDLQIWIKSYMNHNNVKGQHDLGDLQLKIQQIKNNLHKKADHQGMKKGLAFLQGKITQIFMFLTQPESEDAMIVKKGFNCLSCSKKVQNLRGKLGPRMNWDLLNTTNYNNHTPPKGSYSKYSQSPEKEHINNLN